MTDVEVYLTNNEIRLSVANCAVRISSESARWLAFELIKNAETVEQARRHPKKEAPVAIQRPC